MTTAPAGQWRKATRSQNTTNCVELAHTNDMIRDSKNERVLPLNRRAVTELIRAAKTGTI